MFSRKELENLYCSFINNAESVKMHTRSNSVELEYSISPKVDNFDQLENNDYFFSIIFDWTFVSHKVDAAILYKFNNYQGIFDCNIDTDNIVHDYFEVTNRLNKAINKDKIRQQYEEIIELDRPKRTQPNQMDHQPNQMDDFLRLFAQQRRQEHQRTPYPLAGGPYGDAEDNDYDDLPF
jgi:hypothetical protein